MQDKFKWSDKYLVGIKKIDDQHKKIMSLYNELAIAIATKQSRETLYKVLTEIIDNSLEHFVTEEKTFTEIKFPESYEHSLSHDAFRSEAERLLQEMGKGILEIDDSLVNFLESWIEVHIKLEDAKYADFIEDNKLKDY